MTEDNSPWNVGYCLSPEEAEDIFSTSDFVEVYATAAQPNPGVPFSDPYASETLWINDLGHVYESIPDPTDLDASNLTFYWGKLATHHELLKLAIDQIDYRSQHVAAALHFCFDASRFKGWTLDVIEGLPELFWFRCDYQKPDFQFALQRELHKRPFFRALDRFFTDPNSPEFAPFRADIENLGDFSFLYDNFLTPNRAKL